MSEALTHLHPDYRSVALLPDDERIAWIRTERWIGFPKATSLMTRLEALLAYPKRARMPCLLIYGRSGMGKSMTIARMVHLHSPVFNSEEGGTEMPVVVLQMPIEPLEEDFYHQLLKALGVPFPERTAKRRASGLAMRMLKDLGTRMLVVDEINNVLAGTSRQQRLFLNLIRFLTNELSMPIVCAGTPEAHRALSLDPHLADRFDAVQLTPWRDDATFVALLRSLASTRPLRSPSHLESSSFRKKLLQVSDGITSRIFRLIEEAAVAAVQSGSERIDEDMFDDDLLQMPIASINKRGTATREAQRV
jgi:hypothetical protein